MKWARIRDSKIIETIEFDPDGKFHPDIVWQEVPDHVEQKWTISGDEWSAPIVIEPGPDVEPEEPKLSVSTIAFKMSFTSAERIAIYALKDAGDAILKDWFSILDDPRCMTVDLWLDSTKAAVGYLVGKIDGFDAARAAEVLSGKVL